MRLRDVLACMIAEWPEQRPAGLSEPLWRLINRRVRSALVLLHGMYTSSLASSTPAMFDAFILCSLS